MALLMQVYGGSLQHRKTPPSAQDPLRPLLFPGT